MICAPGCAVQTDRPVWRFPAAAPIRRLAAAGRLLGDLDRVYEEYGWTPLDRIPWVTEIRSQVEAAGAGMSAPTTDSVGIAREVVEVLVEIARGEPASVG
jgi:hypothetical protein